MQVIERGFGSIQSIARVADPAEAPRTAHDGQSLIVSAIGIAIVVMLFVSASLHAFRALTIGARFVEIASGIPLKKITTSFVTGVGGVPG